MSRVNLRSGPIKILASTRLGMIGIISNKVRVRVTERTRPDSVWLVHGFGHTAQGLKLAFGRGADDSALMTNILYDPIMGGTGMRGNFVTFRKVA